MPSSCDKIDPNFLGLLDNRASYKLRVGDLKGACADWKKATELGNEGAAKLLKEHCE